MVVTKIRRRFLENLALFQIRMTSRLFNTCAKLPPIAPLFSFLYVRGVKLDLRQNYKYKFYARFDLFVKESL